MNGEMQELMHSNPEWYKELQYQDVKAYIKDNINSASRSFVAIGYYLKYIRDNELYVEDGYQSIWEFAQAEFGISKSSASRFMTINDRFSKDGNSPILLDRYKDFSSSKLSEMLTMTDEQLEQVSITTTVAEIREIKNADKVVATSQQESGKAYPPCKFGGGECTLYCNPNTACWLETRCSNSFITGLQMEPEPAKQLPKVCKYDGKSNCVAMCNTGAECCGECENHGDCNCECGWQDERMPKPSGKCIHRDEFTCTLPEASKLAKGDGVNCNAKCCWSCPKHGECGYECNSSAQRPKADDISEIMNDKSNIVDNEPEIVNDVDDSDPVETVEADIIQTVLEKKNEPLFSEKYHMKELIKREEETLNGMRESWAKNNPDALRKHELMLLAYKCLLTDLEYPNPEPVKQEQPELPLLRNNDQRKAFIEAFESWPVWIDIKETEERYYRYDLDNEIYIVVKVYFQKGYSWGELKKEDYWGSNEYYLVKSPESHFKDCQTNMTALIEYLKDYQKRK